jgi:tetratricopeptide (TPR) repeat protein
MNRQENELRKRRAEESRQQKAEEIGRLIAERLDNIEKVILRELPVDSSIIRETAYRYPDVVFVGSITNEELQMPWEDSGQKELSIKNDRAGELMLQAQKAEFSMNNLRRAKTLYAQALSAAASPSQRSFIQIQMGRIYSKSGDEQKALQLYEEILSQPGDLTDEYGIPFSLFAADRLSATSEGIEPIIIRLEEFIKEVGWLPPDALYFIRDISAQIKEKSNSSSHLDRVQNLEQFVDDRLETLEKIQSLKSLVTAWMSRRQSSSQAVGSMNWESYGDIPWIIRIRDGLEDGEQYLFSFHGPKTLSAVIEENNLANTYPGTCQILSSHDIKGISLGGALRDFWILFEENSVSAWSRSSLFLPIFYWSILILVVGFTGFGTYLLLRDVRRELSANHYQRK